MLMRTPLSVGTLNFELAGFGRYRALLIHCGLVSGLRREESGSDSLKGNSQTVRNALGSSVQYSPESNGKGSHSIGRKRTRT